jgi:hypothetical protein
VADARTIGPVRVLIWLAWTLQARIPRIGAGLDAGFIDYIKG